MKKVTVFLAAVVVLGTVVVAGCSNSKPAAKSEAPAAAQQSVQYTCPMHPEVISDKPGKCPKCGMDLVVKK
ncbi:MAG: hypothetical protein LLG37_05365 [Spirochaetia bacterium]|nr:hypothetical protein [Spirochaetia bacterium]